MLHLVGDPLQEVADLELAEATERGREPAGGDLVGRQARRSSPPHGGGRQPRDHPRIDHGAPWYWRTFRVPRTASRAQPARAGIAAPPLARRARRAPRRACATPTTFMSPALRPGVAAPRRAARSSGGRPAARAATAFCGDPAHLADVAGAVDRAADRDLLAAGEVAGRQVVDDREREREPARRAADVTRWRSRFRPGSARRDRSVVRRRSRSTDLPSMAPLGAAALVTGTVPVAVAAAARRR